MQSPSSDPKTQELLDLFEAARTDPRKQQALLRQPREVFPALASIDPELRDAVARGIQAAAGAIAPTPEAGAKRSLAKSGVKSFGGNIQAKVEWWGVVVTLDHAAVQELPNGVDGIGGLAEAAVTAMAAVAKTGPIAPLLVAGIAYWTAVFAAYFIIIPAIDQGKGIYLTISWPQIALFTASGGLFGPVLFPVPTAVI